MDELRKLRIVVAPFFYMMWIGVGLLYTGRVPLDLLRDKIIGVTPGQVALVTAVAAAATLPLGFVVSNVSIWLLRIGFRVLGKKGQRYEALSTEDLEPVWRHLHVRDTDAAKQIDGHELYATATFDHGVIKPELSEWTARRWNSFSIAAHSATAVGMAFVTHCLLLGWNCCWASLSFIMVAFLAWSAKASWRETMGMLRFQALRNHDERRGTSESSPSGAGPGDSEPANVPSPSRP